MKAIKEKNLNNVQRKMLDTIYSKELEGRATEYRNGREVKRKALIQTIKDKAQKKYKPVFNEAAKLAKKLQKLEKTLREEGLGLSQSIPTSRFEINYKGSGYSRYSSTYTTTKNPLVEKFDEETKDSEAKLNDLKNEIRADIYGLQITYTEIRAELDKKIKALKLA